MTSLCTLWTRCMGGRRGCPRRWFFPGIAGLYLLLTPLILLYVELAFKLGWGVTRGFFFTLQALSLVPLPLLSTPAGLAGVAAMDAATTMEAGAIELAPTGTVEIALFAVLTCALLLLAFLYALVLLRLRDAGKSPLHLLAGCLPALGLLLVNVTMWSLPLYWTGLAGGSLWLFIVYCLPGRREEQGGEPADSEEAAADAPFRGIGLVACIGFLLLQFGLMLMHGCEPGSLLPLFLCVGALPAILLLFPGKGGGCFWPRGLALAALYLIFIPFQFFAWYAISSDALGIIIVFIAAPLAHTLWLLFAAPWFYQRLRQA